MTSSRMVAHEKEMMTFSVTDQCNVRCAHCLALCSPKQTTMLTADEMYESYLSIAATRPVRTVVFTGGEPTLLGEELLEAIARISLEGPVTRVVTNASWATDDDAANVMVQQLRSAGLAEINFSMDDYHASWIPPENVRRAFDASRGQGFEAVVIALAEGPRSTITREWVQHEIAPGVQFVDQRSSRAGAHPPRSADGTLYEIAHHGYSRVGRARGFGEEDIVPDESMLAQYCCCAEILSQPVVDARLDAGICCGLSVRNNRVLRIGSLRESTYAELADAAQHDVLIRALRFLGPKYLLDVARSIDPRVRMRPEYAGICEVCEDVTASRRALAALDTAKARIALDVALAERAQQGDDDRILGRDAELRTAHAGT
ncbi:radical SAM protein [Propionibacterium acidifaciens]|nr:radical SAM protein [Propionibacterium acidifaciens]